MKIKKYTNGAWVDLDKPVKKFDDYTDTATTLPLTIEASATDAIENYQVYGSASGTGIETENLVTKTIQGVTINSVGTLVSSAYFNASIAPITVGKKYTLLRDYTNSSLFYAFFTELPTKSSTSYDENRETSNQLSVTITAPITGYVVVLNKEGKSTVAEGNAAIPYGYKIPLLIDAGVNLWNDRIRQNGIAANGDIISSSIYVHSIITDLIAGEKYTVEIDDDKKIKAVFAYNGGTMGTKIGMIVVFPGVSRLTFTLPSGANSVGVSLGYYSDDIITPSDVTLAKLTNPSNYDLFIGDSKLGAEEYLDYGEQKVYKRTVQLFNKDTITSGAISVSGILPSSFTSHSDFIPVTPTETYFLNKVRGQSSYYSCVEYGENKSPLRNRVIGNNVIVSGTLQVNSDAYYIRINFAVSDTADVYAYHGTEPLENIPPYLQPTDPPVPFPTLTTYLGENSIDVDTTTIPDKVVLEYKGWKGIGEPQIYDGGEWKDEPSEDINLVYQLDNAYWSDGYVKDDGTIASNRPDFQYNEHFAIEPSTTYVLAYESSSLDCEVSWYTEDKTFIRTDETMNERVCFFTSPSNAKYAILSVPTVTSYLLFAKKSDVNSIPQITNPIDGINWKQGWIKSDSTINTDSDYAYYDGVIDVSDCSKVFVGHSNLLDTSKRDLETYEMDSSDQRTAYKDEPYTDGTYKELSLNANTTKLRLSTSRCTDVMVIKSRVYYKS